MGECLYAAHFVTAECPGASTRGGIPIVEITMTNPELVGIDGPLDFVPIQSSSLRRHRARYRHGAPVRGCGCRFRHCSSLNPVIMEFAAKQNVAVLPGALTPTEVVTAWSAGADFVKVFPCGPVGGDRYIKALHASLPHIPLIAAGGGESTDSGQFHFVRKRPPSGSARN